MSQLELATRCPRCGQHLVPLVGLAACLSDDAKRVAEALGALESMRLVLPAIVPSTLRALEDRWPTLAAALSCHAGTCTRRKPL